MHGDLALMNNELSWMIGMGNFNPHNDLKARVRILSDMIHPVF
jgi:hypothetical protein